MASKTVDVVIVGGAVMGSATAYYLLKANPNLKVTVIEKDASYHKSSSVLSDGNQRIQFNLKENIQMSLYGQEVYKSFAQDMAVDGKKVDIAFKQEGNLFIVNEESKEAALEGLARQQSLGADVQWLEPAEVKAIYPHFNLDDCVGATFGPKDGSFSPLDMLLAYRNKAISLGASYIEADVECLLSSAKEITGAKLKNGDVINSSVVLASAGAWVNLITEAIGVKLPIKPIKRQVYFIKSHIKTSKRLPAFFLPTGNYLFHEAEGNFSTGGALASDPETYDDFSCSKERFEEYIWPVLAHYLPELEQLKMTKMWAGLYAYNTLDANGIIGEWPDIKGLYFANGFSGHGLQQCHAIGRYLSECILGQKISLDLSILSPQRILENKPVFENPRRLI